MSSPIFDRIWPTGCDPGAGGCPALARLGLDLPEGEEILGRDADSAIWIFDPSVSRKHARILVNGGGAVLEDLGSKNGSFHAGRRLEGRVPLRDGEGFRIGSVDLVLRAASFSASTATAP